MNFYEDPQVLALLSSFGCNITSSFVYDFIKSKIGKRSSADELINELATKLKCANSKELATKLVALFNEQNVLNINKISGEISVSAEKVNEFTGVVITKPTHIMPGTKIRIDVGEVDNMTGLRIG